MKFVEYSFDYAYRVFYNDDVDDFKPVIVDNGIYIIFRSPVLKIDEIRFSKEIFKTEDNVKDYWLSHKIEIVDNNANNNAIQINELNYLLISDKKPLPLLYDFISQINNNASNIKDLFKKYYEKEYSIQEYLELYEYLEKYYNKEIISSEFTKDYYKMPEHILFYDKIEEMANNYNL